MKFAKLLIPVMMFLGNVQAQDYNAIHGSNYSGSLGVYNNPATIVNTPYKWDLTLFGLQYQTITNAVRGPNFPLNLSPSGEYDAANGNYRRYGDMNLNMKLLNGRFSINETTAVAFGINLRGYIQAQTSTINFNDSVFGPRTFLFYNEPNRSLNVDATSSLWMEFFGSYARTVWNNETSRLNAGGTLKLMRGMSGGFARIDDVLIESGVDNDQTVYRVAGGTGRYGYSANLDDGDDVSARNIVSGAKIGFAFDLGVEYLVKTQAVTDIYDEGLEHDYEWKIGLSLLDLGWNNYAHSARSRSAANFRNDVDAQTLTNKFNNVDDARSFNDSVATLVDQFDALTGNFKIFVPARAVINVDRYVSGNFFVNAELSVGLASGGNNNYAVKSSKLLTLTPRWETRKLGVFMPVQVTRHGNFWMGAALKAGPLLLGTHNILNAFSKKRYVAGGAYIAVTIRPVNFVRNIRNRQYECPEY